MRKNPDVIDNINARDLKQTSLTWSRVDNLHCDDNVYG